MNNQPSNKIQGEQFSRLCGLFNGLLIAKFNFTDEPIYSLQLEPLRIMKSSY